VKSGTYYTTGGTTETITMTKDEKKI